MTRPHPNDIKGLGPYSTNEDEINSEIFNIFQPSTLNSSIIKGKTQKIYPVNALTDTGPYDFHIPSSNDYIYMPLTRVRY